MLAIESLIRTQNDRLIGVIIASLLVGAVYVQTNPAYDKDDLAYFIDDTTPKVIICNDRSLPTVNSIISSANCSVVYTLNMLVDCNNFYASCEQVFNPKLEGKPIGILSNNDGCVIACSNMLKSLVPMGMPTYQISPVILKQVTLLSSNY